MGSQGPTHADDHRRNGASSAQPRPAPRCPGLCRCSLAEWRQRQVLGADDARAAVVYLGALLQVGGFMLLCWRLKAVAV